MPFNWPPSVAGSTGNAQTFYPSFYPDEMRQWMHYDSTNGYYLAAAFNYNASTDSIYWGIPSYPNSNSLGSSGLIWNGTYTAPWYITTTNSVQIYSGANYVSWFLQRTFPDFSNALTAISDCTEYTGGTTRYLVRSSEAGTSNSYASTYTAPGQVWDMGHAQNGRTSFWLNRSVQVGTSMGQPVYKWRISECSFTAGFSLGSVTDPFPLDINNDYQGYFLLDAGEGFYYIIYRYNNSQVGIRAIDLVNPVGNASIHGTFWFGQAAGWEGDLYPHAVTRYVNIGGNRVCMFHTTTFFVTITFTSTTKLTPTVVKTARTGPAAGSVIGMEHDPATGETYLTAYRVTSPDPITLVGRYASVSTPGQAWSAETTIATVSAPNSPNNLRTWSVGCAVSGEAKETVVIGATSLTFGDGYPFKFRLQYWSTPQEFTPSVTVASTYTSVAAGREVSKPRNIAIASTYSSVALGYSLSQAHGDTFYWDISASSEISVNVNVESTYSAVALDAVEITLLETTPLSLHWTNIGHTFHDDLLTYINAERAAIGLPAYKAFKSDAQFLERRDVANLHSNNMQWKRTYQHESVDFPAGEQTISQRGEVVGGTGISENIQLGYTYDLLTDTNYGYPTAYQMFTVWKNSPVHYGNIRYNWGEDNSKAYSLFSLAEGIGPFDQPSFTNFICLYTTNNFVILETVMYEITLGQEWSNTGATIAELPQQWSNASWTPVSNEHTAPYSVRVASDTYEAVWGARAAIEHVAPITYTAGNQITFPYEGTTLSIRQQNEGPYSIKDTTTVVKEVEHEYALTVTKQIEFAYSVMVPIAQQAEAGYAIKDTERVVTEGDAPWSLVVSARYEAPYSLLVPARTQNEAPFAVSDTERVVTQTETPWSLAVSSLLQHPYALLEVAKASNEAGYAIKDTEAVVKEMNTPWGLSVSAAVETPFALLNAVKASSEAGYRIRDTEPVITQHDASWALRVQTQHEATFTLLLRAASQTEAGYSIYDTEPVKTEHEAKYSFAVSSSNQAVWTINTTTKTQHVGPYGDRVRVVAQTETGYDLLVSNPIRAGMSHYYDMQDFVSTLVNNNEVTLTLPSGLVMRVMDGVIESSESDVGYTFECGIADLSVYALINEDDPVVVNFCGEVHNFIVSGKSMSRDGPTNIGFRLSANNAVMRLGQPYGAETDFSQEAAAYAADLVDALVEISFTYEIVNWTIPAGRLQVAGATALEAVAQIAEAAGGVVDGNPDGTMRIRYPYPHPMNALDTASVDQSYSDSYDNLSVSSSSTARDGANKFRIREGDSAFADSLEWIPDEVQADPALQTGIVKAYLSPYRTTATIVHLGNASFVVPIGEEIETLEELIEFNEGVGNTKRPIESLTSVEWITASLGSPAYSPFSTTLTVSTAVNSGYGLAKVTYNAKHLTVRAGGVPADTGSGEVGPPSSYAYFVLEDSNG